MVNSFRFVERDQEIVHSLANRVRLFSLGQIAKHWFEGDRANARRRCRQLTEADLVIRLAVRARPLPPLTCPVFAWRPGDDKPDTGKIAYALRSRWYDRPVRDCSAFIATPYASQLFGGKARGDLKQATQVTHDLGVAQVFLGFRNEHPQYAKAWRGEDVMAHTRLGQKLPDAFILNHQEKTLLVVEFGGSYDDQRVSEFHADCVQRQLPYQIW